MTDLLDRIVSINCECLFCASARGGRDLIVPSHQLDKFESGL